MEARIAVVTEKEIVPEAEVREKFKRVKPLKDISVTQRGWTLDVLNVVRWERDRRGCPSTGLDSDQGGGQGGEVAFVGTVTAR